MGLVRPGWRRAPYRSNVEKWTRQNAETALSTPAGTARRAVSCVECAARKRAELVARTDPLKLYEGLLGQ